MDALIERVAFIAAVTHSQKVFRDRNFGSLQHPTIYILGFKWRVKENVYKYVLFLVPCYSLLFFLCCHTKNQKFVLDAVVKKRLCYSGFKEPKGMWNIDSNHLDSGVQGSQLGFIAIHRTTFSSPASTTGSMGRYCLSSDIPRMEREVPLAPGVGNGVRVAFMATNEPTLYDARRQPSLHRHWSRDGRGCSACKLWEHSLFGQRMRRYRTLFNNLCFSGVHNPLSSMNSPRISSFHPLESLNFGINLRPALAQHWKLESLTDSGVTQASITPLSNGSGQCLHVNEWNRKSTFTIPHELTSFPVIMVCWFSCHKYCGPCQHVSNMVDSGMHFCGSSCHWIDCSVYPQIDLPHCLRSRGWLETIAYSSKLASLQPLIKHYPNPMNSMILTPRHNELRYEQCLSKTIRTTHGFSGRK